MHSNQLETDHFEIIMSTDQPKSVIGVSNQLILGKRGRPPGDQLGQNEIDFSPRSPKSKEIEDLKQEIRRLMENEKNLSKHLFKAD